MPNASIFAKIDRGLALALRAWEQSGDRDADDGISVGLRFEGDLGAIEALGFESHSVSGDEARGVVRFKDVGALAAHPGVLWIAAGRAPRPNLEVAPKDIRARASEPDRVAVGGDGLWHALDSSDVLTSGADATGAGVIVAVIDSGIDYTHPMFMSQLTPPKVTRILRIWDQGLRPAALVDCPDVALLQSPHSYGVEFDDQDINDALNGVTPMIAHRDCIGHGTHVAGIAAGGVKFPVGVAGADASRVGVAPEAAIIVVKYLDTPDNIRFRLAARFGDRVGWDDRFQDAVLYCLRTARREGKPVVINMSFTNPYEPGDALDDDAQWVDALLDPAQTPGSFHFPQGAIIVKAAGNNGKRSRRQVARIVFPPGPTSTITVPLELKDDHGTNHDTWKTSDNPLQGCDYLLHKPTLNAAFWYRRNFDNVKFAVKLPHRTTFDADMGVGGNFDHGLILRPGPTPALAFVPIAANVHRVSFTHGGNPAVSHPAGGTVRRHMAYLEVTPKVSGGNVSYLEGIYEVRITAPARTEIFVMGARELWAPLMAATLVVATTMADGTTALDPVVEDSITSEYSATNTLGQHVITVGAYDDKNTVGGPDHPIASFSSRGPLRDFSDPPLSKPLVAVKPDIAAPGVKISSALGVDTDVGVVPRHVRSPPWMDGVRFIPNDGTSMAAPMVAGVIALMLQKNATLSTTDVRTILTAAAAGRPGNNPTAPGTPHDYAYGSGMLAARESYDRTP